MLLSVVQKDCMGARALVRAEFWNLVIFAANTDETALYSSTVPYSSC